MELLEQLKQVFFFTGAFLIAWSWALVYYAVAHVTAGQSPLQDQIGFGGGWHSNSLLTLIGQYLIVCALTAVALLWLKKDGTAWAASLAVAVEFFPSPIFSGALMGYLGQFTEYSFVERCALNVLAAWVIAALTYAVPTCGQFGLLSEVMQKTVGFGLGVAWNSLASAIVPVTWGFRAHTVFLVLVILLAASSVVPEPEPSSLRQRHASLLSFASKVVCAFLLTGWLPYFMPAGWLGSMCSEIYLIIQAAFFSCLVANLDVDRPASQAPARQTKPDAIERLVRCLVMIPCVWCCCPCIPLLWLLSGPHAGVKGRWLRLIADVSSLAASVVGTNLLTDSIDALATGLRICGADSCNVFLFLPMEILGAALVSVILLAAITPLCMQPVRDAVEEEAMAYAPILEA